MNVTHLANSSHSISNVTSIKDLLPIIEYYAPIAMAINKYVTPVWYAIGLVGNVISALIWSNQRLRTCNTAAFYLTSLALADFSFLLLHLFYELENPWLIHTLNVEVWCEVWNTLYMAVQYLCVLLVCAFTTERFLSVCHPFRSERFGRTRSPRIILFLLVASLALASPQAYFWEVAGSSECHVRASEMMNASFYAIWNWCSDMLVFGAVPLLVLALNIGVLRKIRHAGHLRLQDSATHSVVQGGGSLRLSIRSGKHNLLRSNSSSCTGRNVVVRTGSGNAHGGKSGGTGSGQSFTATTVTLLWVSFYLIFTTLPVTIVFAIQMAIRLGPQMPLHEMGSNPEWQRYIAYFTARVVIKEIGMSHHVGNVFIYLATCRRFRRQVQKRVLGMGPNVSKTINTECTSVNGVPMNILRSEEKDS